MIPIQNAELAQWFAEQRAKAAEARASQPASPSPTDASSASPSADEPDDSRDWYGVFVSVDGSLNVSLSDGWFCDKALTVKLFNERMVSGLFKSVLMVKVVDSLQPLSNPEGNTIKGHQDAREGRTGEGSP